MLDDLVRSKGIDDALKHLPSPLAVVAGKIAHVDIERHIAGLRPSVNSEMRLREDHRAGDPGIAALFIRVLGMDFLRASVSAKILNVATNLAAISFFAGNVELMWKLGLTMALCNLIGSILGSRMALKHGAGFVRRMFLAVVSVLIAKLAYDTFLR